MTDAKTHAALPEDGRTPSLREWVRDHDESWIFVVLYLGLAVGLSVFVSLFWLVVVAGLHFLLELLRQRHYREGPRSVVLHALWEVKLDVGLVLLALTLVLYIEVILGILGIQSVGRAAAVTRAGARVGTRAAAWERNLRTFLLTVDEMARVVHAGVMLRRKGTRPKAVAPGAAIAPVGSGDVEATTATTATTAPTAPTPPTAPTAPTPPTAPTAPGPPRPSAWSLKWKLGDRIGLALVAAGLVMMAAAPYLTSHDWASARAVLAEELRPFPESGGDE